MRTEPKFPTSIKVGWKTYAIEDWCHKIASANARYGEADHAEKTIRIDRSYGALQSAETLLHEVLHAVWDIWQISESGCHEEEYLVASQASGLTAVWRDNPEFAAWYAWAVYEGVSA